MSLRFGTSSLSTVNSLPSRSSWSFACTCSTARWNTACRPGNRLQRIRHPAWPGMDFLGDCRNCMHCNLMKICREGLSDGLLCAFVEHGKCKAAERADMFETSCAGLMSLRLDKPNLF